MAETAITAALALEVVEVVRAEQEIIALARLRLEQMVLAAEEVVPQEEVAHRLALSLGLGEMV